MQVEVAAESEVVELLPKVDVIASGDLCWRVFLGRVTPLLLASAKLAEAIDAMAACGM